MPNKRIPVEMMKGEDIAKCLLCCNSGHYSTKKEEEVYPNDEPNVLHLYCAKSNGCCFRFNKDLIGVRLFYGVNIEKIQLVNEFWLKFDSRTEDKEVHPHPWEEQFEFDNQDEPLY